MEGFLTEVARIVEATVLVESAKLGHFVGGQLEVEDRQVLPESLRVGGLGDDDGWPLTADGSTSGPRRLVRVRADGRCSRVWK